MAKQTIIVKIEWEKENESFFLADCAIKLALNRVYGYTDIDFKVTELENKIVMDIFE